MAYKYITNDDNLMVEVDKNNLRLYKRVMIDNATTDWALCDQNEFEKNMCIVLSELLNSRLLY